MSRIRRPRAVAAGVLVAVLLPAGVDLLHWRASRQGLPRSADAEPVAPEVVLVLGHPTWRSGAVHPMQRWRTVIAVRSLRTSTGRLVFSGAGPDGGPSEAEVMAAWARRALGVPADRIVLETRATSTWENVACSLAVLEQAGTIRIASSPVHAARARRYLARQRPDLARRLAPADDQRWGERYDLKLLGLGYALGRVLLRGHPRVTSVVTAAMP